MTWSQGFVIAQLTHALPVSAPSNRTPRATRSACSSVPTAAPRCSGGVALSVAALSTSASGARPASCAASFAKCRLCTGSDSSACGGNAAASASMHAFSGSAPQRCGLRPARPDSTGARLVTSSRTCSPQLSARASSA